STDIGMNSCTWQARDLRSSFSGSQGSETSRTTTRWLPTESETRFDLNFPRLHSSFMASPTSSGWRTSPFSTAPAGTGTWPARTTAGPCARETTSAARTAVEPMSSPISDFATTRLRLDRPLREVPVHVRLPDPVVLPHPDRRELPALDEAVDRHVRNPHGRRHLRHGQQPVPDERPPLRHQVTPSTRGSVDSRATCLSSSTPSPHVPSFTSVSCATSFTSSPRPRESPLPPLEPPEPRTLTGATYAVNHPI